MEDRFTIEARRILATPTHDLVSAVAQALREEGGQAREVVKGVNHMQTSEKLDIFVRAVVLLSCGPDAANELMALIRAYGDERAAEADEQLKHTKAKINEQAHYIEQLEKARDFWHQKYKELRSSAPDGG